MIGEWISRIDRIQKSRGFMILATSVLVLLGVAAFITVWVNQPPPSGENPLAIAVSPEFKVGGPQKITEEDLAAMQREADRFNKSLATFTAAQGDLTSVAVGITAATGILVAAVWLGIGLSILGLGIVGTLVVLPLSLSPATKDWGRLLGGVLSLTVAFTVIMRGV